MSTHKFDLKEINGKPVKVSLKVNTKTLVLKIVDSNKKTKEESACL